MHKRFECNCSTNDSAANEVIKILPLNKCEVIRNISLVTSEEESLHAIHYFRSTVMSISIEFSIHILKSEQSASAP
jgi:hypothetical protein